MILTVEKVFKTILVQCVNRTAEAKPTINLKRLLYSGLNEFKTKNAVPPCECPK